MIKHCFIKSPHQRNYAVFRERRWNALRTEQSGFIVDFQFHHPIYNNSHRFSFTTLLYRENVNKECYSDFFIVKSLIYRVIKLTSDITKTSELLVQTSLYTSG